MQHWELLIFFLVISFIYASVGFGGGSSYLAILALYALPIKEIRLIALLCNIIVVTGGTYIYIKNSQVNFKKIIPLVLVSVPMAFLGARLKISEQVFFLLLGFSLLVAAVLLWIQTQNMQPEKMFIPSPNHYIKDGLLGGTIGFLSGMVSIGGGIFLSPLLNLMKWDTPKKIAATASLFILVNSISGIIGLWSQIPNDIQASRMIYLCVAVFIGGQLGSRMSVRFNPLVVRRITAILVFFAGAEVLYKHLT
jgi:hypothetical protein